MEGTLAILCIFGLPVIAFIIVRILKYNERMEMIRMGYSWGWPLDPQRGAPVPPGPARASVIPHGTADAANDGSFRYLRAVTPADRFELRKSDADQTPARGGS
ncbi:MAG: hypothetical protein WCE44_15880 [Candidatus Velthaea sp.]|jgi:hypothetical protein